MDPRRFVPMSSESRRSRSGPGPPASRARARGCAPLPRGPSRASAGPSPSRLRPRPSTRGQPRRSRAPRGWSRGRSVSRLVPNRPEFRSRVDACRRGSAPASRGRSSRSAPSPTRIGRGGPRTSAQDAPARLPGRPRGGASQGPRAPGPRRLARESPSARMRAPRSSRPSAEPCRRGRGRRIPCDSRAPPRPPACARDGNEDRGSAPRPTSPNRAPATPGAAAGTGGSTPRRIQEPSHTSPKGSFDRSG